MKKRENTCKKHIQMAHLNPIWIDIHIWCSFQLLFQNQSLGITFTNSRVSLFTVLGGWFLTKNIARSPLQIQWSISVLIQEKQVKQKRTIQFQITASQSKKSEVTSRKSHIEQKRIYVCNKNKIIVQLVSVHSLPLLLPEDYLPCRNSGKKGWLRGDSSMHLYAFIGCPTCLFKKKKGCPTCYLSLHIPFVITFHIIF